MALDWSAMKIKFENITSKILPEKMKIFDPARKISAKSKNVFITG